MYIHAKNIARVVCGLHHEWGASAVLASGRPAGDAIGGSGLKIVNLTTEASLDGYPGRELNPIQVRRFLWEHRKHRALNRPNLVIWTAYVDNLSFIGLGAIVKPKVAARYKGRKIEVA